MTGKRQHLVLVHGLWFRAHFLRSLAQRLGEHGFDVHPFNYRTTKVPLKRSARRLYRFCQRLKVEELSFVAHSLGGLLTLRMLSDWDWDAPGRAVFLGSPLKGSAVARKAVNWPAGDLLIGHAHEPLDCGHSAWPQDREIGMIAGTKPVGLGVLTGQLERPHDGTVAVSETQHPGLTDHILRPYSHTGLIYSPHIPEDVVQFLRTGHF